MGKKERPAAKRGPAGMIRTPVGMVLLVMFLGGGLLHYTALAALQQRIATLENVVRAALPVQDNDTEVHRPGFDL